MEPVYVVTGWRRSGTSMMIQALETGGMDCYYDNEKNGNTHYELPYDVYSKSKWFPRGSEGRVMKVFFDGIAGLAVCKYRIVFMHRDPQAIKMSYIKLKGYDPRGIELYDYAITSAVERARNRRDVLSVTELNYEDVLENPIHEFERLIADGWNFDVDKAAGIIDPGKCHHRAEAADAGAA